MKKGEKQKHVASWRRLGARAALWNIRGTWLRGREDGLSEGMVRVEAVRSVYSEYVLRPYP